MIDKRRYDTNVDMYWEKGLVINNTLVQIILVKSIHLHDYNTNDISLLFLFLTFLTM